MASTALVPNASPPPLVTASGLPLRRADLVREIAGPSVTGVRSILSGHPAQGLTPARLANLLRESEQGDATAYLELAEEMEEKDLHYQSVMGTRKRAVSQLPIIVEAASDSPEDEQDAQLIRDWLDRDTLQIELFDILDAIGKGYSCTEIVWEFGELWLPARLKWRLPQHFEFDRIDGETLYLKGDNGQPQPLQPGKFITHIHQAKSGIPIRGGIARAAAWGYLFKNFTIKDWMAFLEVYGLPLRVGKYDNGETEANIRLLERAVGQIGSDAGAVIPKSMLIEFITQGGGATSSDMFEKKAVYIDQQISKAVLGQTGTTDATAGALATGKAHSEVRGDIRDSDAGQAAATLNRDLVRPMVMFNRGMRKRYPRLKIGHPESDDIDTFLKVTDAAVKHGVPVALSTFRKATGLAEPKAGEELLAAPPTPPVDPATGNVPPKKGPTDLLDPLKTPTEAKQTAAAALNPHPAREPDGIDRAIEDELGDWTRLIEPSLSPIEEAIAAASSLEEIRDLLSKRAGELIDAMDVTQINEVLARAGFGAQLAGRLEKPGS